MNETKPGLRVGVYIDVANLARNGGYGMRYDVLRDFACRGTAEAIRLNAYVGYDVDRADRDSYYRHSQEGFFSLLRDFGYKVIEKNVKWYTDENGNRFGKANADLDLAVDALLQSENLDRVLLATGDGDFVQVVRALQNRGCRVEIVAFENVSTDLRQEADMFMSGYLIPNLLPTSGSRSGPGWGEIGSRVRGVCYSHNAEKGYGFMRVLKNISPGLGRIDSRQPDSPYISVFFHNSRLPDNVDVSELPSRNYIFEFELAAAEGRENGYQANFIQLVSPRLWRNPGATATSPSLSDRVEKTPESLADRHERYMMEQRIIEHLEEDEEEEEMM
ncbi:MAG: NYN domain-containing protein [Chloroflexi bacterium]|nr:NYN domain-containing protein [Chloroflexota bacterium]MBP8055588.1 NYN domain-containing protein [Chloroflexota bacterium]